MGTLNLHISLLPDKTIKDVADTPGPFMANLIFHQLCNTYKIPHKGPTAMY